MQTVLLNYGIPGGSLVVVKDGRLVFARGYGWADIEHDEPFQPDSRCRIASLSKTITAAAAMKLAEADRLDLDTRAFILLNLEPPLYPGAVYDSRRRTSQFVTVEPHRWLGGFDRKEPLGGTGFDLRSGPIGR